MVRKWMIIKEKTCHGRNSDEDAVSIVSLCSTVSFGTGRWFSGRRWRQPRLPEFNPRKPGHVWEKERTTFFFLKLSSDLHVHALVHMYRHTQRPTKINKLKFKKLSIYSGLTYFHNLRMTIWCTTNWKTRKLRWYDHWHWRKIATLGMTFFSIVCNY